MSGSHITKIGRRQSLLLPDMIDDYIDENSPARLFDSFVDSLDLKEMNFKYAVLRRHGLVTTRKEKIFLSKEIYHPVRPDEIWQCDIMYV